jgi:acetyl-CoA C-acetyltransferase
MSTNPCIVGWAHTPFGRLDGLGLEDLVTRVVTDALAHAELPASDVDALWLGHLNGGFVPETFCSSLMLQAHQGLRFKPATRVENACASGAAAVFAALDAIEAGRARVAVVVGAEKMTSVGGAEVMRVLSQASYWPDEGAHGLTFPGIFARIADAYFEKYGDHSAALARIAAKNHGNGTRNPYAHVRRDLGFEFCNTVSERNPIIAGRLRKTDCSMVSDGAAALVITSSDVATSMPCAVQWRSRVQVNDFLPMSRRDLVAFEGPRHAWSSAFAQGGCALSDLSLAEVHDCFTIAELLTYEAMGLAQPGRGVAVLEDGSVMADGRLPVNPSGGLKAKGHPIGATGVSMHVLAAMQLCDQAGAMQIQGAELCGVFNMGGSAVANYVSIMERSR